MNDAVRLGAPRVGPEGYDSLWDDKSRSRYYDRSGNKITFRENAMLWALEEKYRVIGHDDVGRGYFVSTVWLGLDHEFFDGPPLIFESMVFDKNGCSLEMERYSTEEQALHGHRLLVEEYSNRRNLITTIWRRYVRR